MTNKHGKELVGNLAAPSDAFAFQSDVPVLGDGSAGEYGEQEEGQAPHCAYNDESPCDATCKTILGACGGIRSFCEEAEVLKQNSKLDEGRACTVRHVGDVDVLHSVSGTLRTIAVDLYSL